MKISVDTLTDEYTQREAFSLYIGIKFHAIINPTYMKINPQSKLLSNRSKWDRYRLPNLAQRIYKLNPRRTLTPEEEEQAKAVYKDFFTTKNQFKVDPGDPKPFRIS